MSLVQYEKDSFQVWSTAAGYGEFYGWIVYSAVTVSYMWHIWYIWSTCMRHLCCIYMSHVDNIYMQHESEIPTYVTYMWHTFYIYVADISYICGIYFTYMWHMYVAYICDIYVDLVRVTPLSLYPLSGIWQELGPNYSGISSQRVARDRAFDNLANTKNYQFNLVLFKYKSMIH